MLVSLSAFKALKLGGVFAVLTTNLGALASDHDPKFSSIKD